MNIYEQLQASREGILEIAARHGASNVRVFGSAARGDFTADSDIDLLVTMEPGRTLFDLADLTLDLRDLLGHKVDVITDDAIYWLLKRRILSEAQAL